MSEDILIAIIGASASVLVGVLSYWAVVKTNKKANNDIQQQLRISQAVTDTKIEELTREVREHNNFARRMPVVEAEIVHLKEDNKHINKEVHELEREVHEIERR